MNLTLIVVEALASYRLWRLIGQDDWPPSEAFRTWVKAVLPKWVSDLIECPWCLGSYVAFAVVAVTWAIVPSMPLPVLQGLAVACLVGLLGTLDG